MPDSFHFSLFGISLRRAVRRVGNSLGSSRKTASLWRGHWVGQGPTIQGRCASRYACLVMQKRTNAETGIKCAERKSADREEYRVREEPGPIHRERSGWRLKDSRAKRREPQDFRKPKCSDQSLLHLPVLRTPHSGEHASDSRAYPARSNDGSGERLMTRSHGWRSAECGLGKLQLHIPSRRPRRRTSPS